MCQRRLVKIALACILQLPLLSLSPISSAASEDGSDAPYMGNGMNGGMGMMGNGSRSGMMGGNGDGMGNGQASQPPGSANGQDQLTDAQRQQIQNIRQQVAQKDQQVDAKIRAEQDKIQTLLQQPKPDARQVDQAYDTIDALRQQRRTNNAEAQKKINAILVNGNPASSSPQHANQGTTSSSIKMGMAVNQSFCARCHVVPNPMRHTADQWPYVVRRMEGYMYQRRMAMPDAKQTAALLEYLKAGAYPGHATNQ